MYGRLMMTAFKLRAFVVFLLCLYVDSVLGQTPTPIVVGPFDFTSSVELEYLEDDNLFQTPDDETSTGVFVAFPSFELLFDNGVTGISLSYDVEAASFSDVSSEDYVDQQVGLDAGLLFGGLSRIDFGASFSESHDRLSSNGDGLTSEGAVSDNSLDEFEDLRYSSKYTLGTDETTLVLSLLADFFERSYVNNRFVGTPSVAVNALLDREELMYGAELLWNVSPDLKLGGSYNETEVEYDIVQPSRDGDEEVAAFELRWKPTSSLAVDGSLGQTRRSTDDGAEERSDFWDFSINWSIYSYSSLDLFTSSSVEETENVATGFSVRERYGFTWSHGWTDRFETVLSYIDSSTTFEENSTREDTRKELGFSVGYQFRRWLSVSLFVQDVEVISGDLGEQSYDQRVFGLVSRVAF